MPPRGCSRTSASGEGQRRGGCLGGGDEGAETEGADTERAGAARSGSFARGGVPPAPAGASASRSAGLAAPSRSSVSQRQTLLRRIRVVREVPLALVSPRAPHASAPRNAEPDRLRRHPGGLGPTPPPIHPTTSRDSMPAACPVCSRPKSNTAVVCPHCGAVESTLDPRDPKRSLSGQTTPGLRERNVRVCMSHAIEGLGGARRAFLAPRSVAEVEVPWRWAAGPADGLELVRQALGAEQTDEALLVEEGRDVVRGDEPRTRDTACGGRRGTRGCPARAHAS